MALRKKTVDLGGRTVTIGNALLGPLMDFDEAVGARRGGAMTTLVAHALERGGDATPVRDLDADELKALVPVVLRWSWSEEDQPPGEPPSP